MIYNMKQLPRAILASLLTLRAWADDADLLEKAKAIHQRIIAFDSHLDLPFDYSGAAEDGKTQFDLPKIARGQLKGAALAVFVPLTAPPEMQNVKAVTQWFTTEFEKFIRATPDQYWWLHRRWRDKREKKKKKAEAPAQ